MKNFLVLAPKSLGQSGIRNRTFIVVCLCIYLLVGRPNSSSWMESYLGIHVASAVFCDIIFELSWFPQINLCHKYFGIKGKKFCFKMLIAVWNRKSNQLWYVFLSIAWSFRFISEISTPVPWFVAFLALTCLLSLRTGGFSFHGQAHANDIWFSAAVKSSWFLLT